MLQCGSNAIIALIKNSRDRFEFKFHDPSRMIFRSTIFNKPINQIDIHIQAKMNPKKMLPQHKVLTQQCKSCALLVLMVYSRCDACSLANTLDQKIEEEFEHKLAKFSALLPHTYPSFETHYLEFAFSIQIFNTIARSKKDWIYLIIVWECSVSLHSCSFTK